MMEDPFAAAPVGKAPRSDQNVRNEVVGRLEGRLSPEEVNLRPSEDGAAMCGECKNYEMKGQPESPCLIVAAEVRANEVCDMFDPEPVGQGQDSLPPEPGVPGAVQPPTEMM